MALSARLSRWRSATAAAMLLAAVWSSAAQAAPVNFSLTGTVTFADDGNAFGLSAGDGVSLTGTYDDSDYDGVGEGTVDFGDGTGNTLQITLGSIVLDEFMDVDFLGGTFPTITFLDGVVIDTNIVMDIGTNGSPVEFGSGTDFDGEDEFGLFISGVWNVPTPAVPEPGSLALAGSACLAFGFLARRRKLAKLA